MKHTKQQLLFPDSHEELTCEDGKICIKCDKKLPLSFFSPASGGNFLRPECRKCNNHLSKARKLLKLKDGSELTVKKIYSASMKADKKAEAIHWLRDNGLGDIVKNNITVSFGQGEDNKAVDYASLARSNGYEPIQEEKVHPSTLKVVMKEWKDKGQEVPAELFNTFDGNQTYLKNKK